MPIAYSITPELRVKFKEPFGTLVRGSFEETMGRMKEILEKEKPPKLISVGDVVSRNLLEYHLLPQITIIDNKCMREHRPTIQTIGKKVHVTNPQGTISEEAIAAIKEALEKNETIHIIVDGEEDLLVLTAVLYAPDNSLIVYGQPREGIVIVKATAQKKAEAEEFLKAMKVREKLNKQKNVSTQDLIK